ncbi:tautomerase family protein [Streptomyces iconiensis]|uniref:4-oxalocrotonate tautomerase domain-containing protein n=1 Tax=Streptomyces iconiensis TaxID=1384038 RepID=A0ABT7A3S3_9ACTN|nr:hypothetical protein [Streptomyces iconiensis]MDJ1135994.1 hypothetical protein [Streptomyces iconiensis]
MPHFDVRIHEEALDGTAEPQLIHELTEAVVAVYGERFRELVVVELFGIPDGYWGEGGVPSRKLAPVVTLRLREGAFALPQFEKAPAQLISALTDGVVAVFGEEIRERVTVHLVSVPSGRSGVGGELV